MIKELNFKRRRPLIHFEDKDLMILLESSLSPDSLNIELATLANIEIYQRKKQKDDAKKLFKKFDQEPIYWLGKARNSLFTLKKPAKGRYRGKLYVILRNCPPGSRSKYGVYVGSTTKKIEKRFEEHKNPHKSKNLSARGMPKYAIQILYSLSWPWRSIPYKDLLYYEYALNASLSSSIKYVWGDYKGPEEWPDNFQKNLVVKIDKSS